MRRKLRAQLSAHPIFFSFFINFQVRNYFFKSSVFLQTWRWKDLSYKGRVRRGIVVGGGNKLEGRGGKGVGGEGRKGVGWDRDASDK